MEVTPTVIRLGGVNNKTGLDTSDMRAYMLEYRKRNKPRINETQRIRYARNPKKEIARVKAAKEKAKSP